MMLKLQIEKFQETQNLGGLDGKSPLPDKAKINNDEASTDEVEVVN